MKLWLGALFVLLVPFMLFVGMWAGNFFYGMFGSTFSLMMAVFLFESFYADE